LLSLQPTDENERRKDVDAPQVLIKNATLNFGKTHVFSEINVEFPAGKWTAILGESGIGKSSLLRMIAGLLPENIWKGSISTNNHVPIQKQIAYMAQTDLLLPWMNVLDNTLLGSKLRGATFSHSCSSMVIKAKNLLTQVGLGHAYHYYPHQLSGGMRKRVSLVRTLIEDKPIILMDEPFAALDAMTRYHLQGKACHLLKNKTVLFITHDLQEALRLANTIYVMQNRPANIDFFARLTSQIPRELNHPEVIQWQERLVRILFKQDDVS
jgi:putative hydroxymethylpyrimidine transport system ATP-binding protein